MRYVKLLTCSILLLACAVSAQAKINATLSSTAIAQNETVQLRLEAQDAAGMPDLTPLSRDFQVVNTNVGRSTRSFNGRTTQSLTLNLVLQPKHSGRLEIPPLEFGTQRSPAMRLDVAPVADPAGGAEPALAYDNSASPDPGFPMPPGQSWMGGQNPFAVTPWGAPGFGANGWQAPAPDRGWQAPAQPTPPPSLPSPEEELFWPWIAVAAVLGGLLTSFTVCPLRSRRGRSRPKKAAAPAPTPPAPAPTPKIPPADWITRVRKAYTNGDAFAAKDALLQWAAATWPEDPPGNLSRLAARCPEPLQRRLLKLDEALYSPGPVAWKDQPVAELLDRASTKAET